MRFLIHEQAYERPIAAGRLLYSDDSGPTGAVENWRQTEAQDGYQFLRVDLDARNAPSGSSTLYHMTFGPNGQPEQLKYRYWDSTLRLRGNLVWTGNEAVGSRTVIGEKFGQVGKGDVFWFPSTVSVSRLSASPKGDGLAALRLQSNVEQPDRALALVEASVSLSAGEADSDAVPEAISILVVSWDDQQRRVWLSASGYPLRLVRQDGLTAVVDELMQYH